MPRGFQRDSLSPMYDGAVWDLMYRAARASKHRQGVRAWIASPRGEFRQLDSGGRTRHERAFTRAAYYLVWRVPINTGVPRDWSLKLTWGSDAERRPSSGGKLARPVVIRLFPASQARVTGRRWHNPAA